MQFLWVSRKQLSWVALAWNSLGLRMLEGMKDGGLFLGCLVPMVLVADKRQCPSSELWGHYGMCYSVFYNSVLDISLAAPWLPRSALFGVEQCIQVVDPGGVLSGPLKGWRTLGHGSSFRRPQGAGGLGVGNGLAGTDSWPSATFRACFKGLL